MQSKRLEIKCKKTKDFIDYDEEIRNSDRMEKFARKFYHEDILLYESFFVIMLNSHMKPIGWAKISQGGLNQTIVDIRIIAKFAIDCLASGIVLVHNHPSGSLKPSQMDIDLTERAKNALKLFNIKVIDHLILTENAYLSMNDNGMLIERKDDL